MHLGQTPDSLEAKNSKGAEALRLDNTHTKVISVRTQYTQKRDTQWVSLFCVYNSNISISAV